MKTMKKHEEIKRVPEKQVDEYLKDGWEFCGKEEWKREVRDSDVLDIL